MILATSAMTAFAGVVSTPTEWKFDAAHSAATFKIKHMVVSKVTGTIVFSAGSFFINEKDFTKSRFEGTLDASTVNTNNTKRDEHLKSAEFFDVAKYPTIVFTSKKITKWKAGKYKVSGELTLHGITKPVTIECEPPTAVIKDSWGIARRGFSATSQINRRDFGMLWNKPLEIATQAGALAIGENVEIQIDSELIPPMPETDKKG
jgi:polyisoprenoid-binding protein YceI